MGRMMRCATFAAAVFAACSPRAIAEDIVIYKSGSDESGRSQSRGEIIDFTGEELKMRQTSGRESRIPADKIVEIRSEWTPQHTTGDSLFAAGKSAEALEQYAEAVRVEHRVWAKRKILARQVWCLRATNQQEQACAVFLSIFNNDSTTQYFDAIPLSWKTQQPGPALERQCKTWLAGESQPIEKLIAASWLFSTADRGAALDVLGLLTNDPDPRIAHLAEAQRWRAMTVVAKIDDVARWQKQIERMPKPLRAGPGYIVAQALSRLEQHEPAALAYMQVAIFFPHDRELAASSLHGAALELEQLGRTAEAVGLYREVTSGYADVPIAAESTGRLNALAKSADAE